MALSRIPRIAVLLPVYNGADYLAEAIGSVLSQTFTDFELIVIDDGSTDGSAAIIDGIEDSRIRVIRFRENRGLVQALNRGIAESRSELIARMDADDICLPHRFARQVAYLDTHPEVVICGSWVRQFGSGAESISRPPAGAEQIRAQLFFGWAMDHPSIMLRRDFLARHGLAYDDQWRHVEDYDFFIRAAELAPLANIPEVLLLARDHRDNVSRIYRAEQVATESRLVLRQLRSLIPRAQPEDESDAFHLRVAASISIEPDELARADRWLMRLDRANHEVSRFERAVFRRELQRLSFDLHASAAGAGLRILTSYWNSPLTGYPGSRALGMAALAKKSVLARMVGLKKSLRNRPRGQHAAKAIDRE